MLTRRNSKRARKKRRLGSEGNTSKAASDDRAGNKEGEKKPSSTFSGAPKLGSKSRELVNMLPNRDLPRSDRQSDGEAVIHRVFCLGTFLRPITFCDYRRRT